MKTKSSLNREMRLAFGSAILVLLVVCTISYRGMAVCRESDQRHTKEVIRTVQHLGFAMESIEPISSRFLLAGKKSLLESYRANPLRIEQNQATIRNLMVDDPDCESQPPAIEGPTADKIERLEKVISLRQTEGLTATIWIFGTAVGWLISVAASRGAGSRGSARRRPTERSGTPKKNTGCSLTESRTTRSLCWTGRARL